MMLNRWSLCSLAVAVCMLLSACAPTTALAAEKDTVKGILKLLKADVGEDVVIAYIQKSGIPAELDADEIVDLKKAGATDKVLIALMGGAVGPVGTIAAGGFPFDLDKDHQVAAPITHGIMAVYPIYRKGPASVERYLTLDEATAQKVIKVTEKGRGSVPVVIIVNSGDLPIYISAGEVVIGGKQDRMIAYDVIVKPKSEISVDVRCVEQGRWAGARQDFASSGAMAGRRAKMAVQFSDQSAVWREVSAQNARAGAVSSSDSLKATLTSPEVKKTHKEYEDAILPKLEGRHLVGMIVAINGKIQAIEMFGSPGLFDKVKGKLLKGFVLDVIGVRDEGQTPPDKATIVKFYNDSVKAEAEKLKEYQYNANRKRANPDSIANESVDADGMVLHRSILAR